MSLSLTWKGYTSGQRANVYNFTVVWNKRKVKTREQAPINFMLARYRKIVTIVTGKWFLVSREEPVWTSAGPTNACNRSSCRDKKREGRRRGGNANGYDSTRQLKGVKEWTNGKRLYYSYRYFSKLSFNKICRLLLIPKLKVIRKPFFFFCNGYFVFPLLTCSGFTS